MNLRMAALAVFAISIMVVGIIEWVKAGWRKIFGTDCPSWLPWVLSPVGCVAFAAIAGPLAGFSGWWFAVLGFLALAVTEIGYQTIVQGLQNVVQAAANMAENAASKPPGQNQP